MVSKKRGGENRLQQAPNMQKIERAKKQASKASKLLAISVFRTIQPKITKRNLKKKKKKKAYFPYCILVAAAYFFSGDLGTPLIGPLGFL